MPSFQDSAVIFFIALLLFGPKKLPELARYVGKLMNEFRRASNEFRMQMNDEFRQIEQAEQQKKIAAMEAAAPLAPAITADIPDPEHPHLQPIPSDPETVEALPLEAAAEAEPDAASQLPAPAPLPIASSGDLNLMPPSTGLPVARAASVNGLFDSIPQTADPAAVTHETEAAHG
jgi:sec-independent protein translocase protein TatB